ncbi:hypothetical protein [Actinomadura rugatobispora]|uniref:Uncharacterized protein n=1 Tax=Actinomadura rugatobispora TaxID=1994 RepID=A0ABW1A9L1_9ACTN|nr:hypothetical protein GCM10010200_022200 [Actinomadura rugatobispora]
MRNLNIPDQSWTMQSETAEAQQAEVTEVQELDESADLEYGLTFVYARV